MNSNPYNAEDRFDQDAMDDHEAPQVHLWDYVQIVLQRLPLVLCVLLASMVLAAVYTWTRTPRFTASARLLVQPGQIDLTDMKGAYDPVSAGLNQRDFMQTQVKLITSQPVIATVLEKANLISDPQFSESSDPIRELTAQISVEPLRNTYLIDISTERQSARQSQRIVNELMDAFMAQDQKRRMGISEKGLQELEAKAESLRGKLDAASQKLRDFMVDNKMVSLEKTQNVIIDRLRDISRHLTAAEPVRMAMEARVEAANQAMEKGQTVDSLPDVMKSPVVKDLKLEMAKLEREYSQLLQRLGENHPQLQAISTQIESLQTKLGLEASSILAALNNEYEQARKEEELLRQALANFKQDDPGLQDAWIWTNPVKQYPPNAAGLYGMAGNVWEWCQDWYFDRAYTLMRVRHPKDPCIESEHVSGLTHRAMRGGSFRNPLDMLRCASRGSGIPRAYSNRVGFRCVRSAITR